MNSTERKGDAAGPLDQLAVQLRKLGLTVTVAKDRTPFPAVLVSAGRRRAVVMAGRVHYWRRLPNGDMRRLAQLDKPERAARAVHEHLTAEPRHARRSSSFRFWENAGAPVGGVRGLAVAGGPPPVRQRAPLRLVDACEVAG